MAMSKFSQFLLLALFAGTSLNNQMYAIKDSSLCGGIAARCFQPFRQLKTPELLDCLKLRGGSSSAEMDESANEEFDFQDENGKVNLSYLHTHVDGSSCPENQFVLRCSRYGKPR